MADEVADSVQALPLAPNDRSGVVNYLNPNTHPQKFEKGEKVHLSVRENGMRRAIELAIGETRMRSDGNRTWREYNLEEADGTRYEDGKFYKESELKQSGAGSGSASGLTIA